MSVRVRAHRDRAMVLSFGAVVPSMWSHAGAGQLFRSWRRRRARLSNRRVFAEGLEQNRSGLERPGRRAHRE